jgi:biopolymer transport protein TolR
MGFQLSNKNRTLCEINVTPLVDVMLCLLVIFMITAPLLLNGIPLKLPQTRKVTALKPSADHIILSYSKEQEFFIGKEKVLFPELLTIIKEFMQQKKTDVLYLRADYSLSYGLVAKLIAHLKEGGISQIALVTEQEAVNKVSLNTRPKQNYDFKMNQ